MLTYQEGNPVEYLAGTAMQAPIEQLAKDIADWHGDSTDEHFCQKGQPVQSETRLHAKAQTPE